MTRPTEYSYRRVCVHTEINTYLSEIYAFMPVYMHVHMHTNIYWVGPRAVLTNTPIVSCGRNGAPTFFCAASHRHYATAAVPQRRRGKSKAKQPLLFSWQGGQRRRQAYVKSPGLRRKGCPEKFYALNFRARWGRLTRRRHDTCQAQSTMRAIVVLWRSTKSGQMKHPEIESGVTCQYKRSKDPQTLT